MAEPTKQKAQSSFLQSPKARVFLALGLVIVVVAGIAFFVHWRSKLAEAQGSAGVSTAPDISSVPGAGNPSAAYVKAQTQANIQGEIAARKSATAYVPTITRPGFIGNPSQFGQLPSSTDAGTAPANCPTSKVVVMYKPNPESCTPKNLDLARQTGVTAEELLCQGCACPALKGAGYTAGDLKQIGMTADQLKSCGFSLSELVSAGFSAADLKDAGFSAADLKAAGFTAGQLRAAGFSAGELSSAGYSPSELKAAGFGEPDNCDIDKLKQERAAGMTAAQLKSQGCGAAALKAAGFSAADLKAAGFSATDLKEAGFSNAELSAAGFTPAEIKAADEAANACSVDKIKQERAAGMTAAQLKSQGCGAAALKAAGFTAGELKAAGFSAADLKAAGFTATDLKDAGFSAAELSAAGYSPAQIRQAELDSTTCNLAKLTKERMSGVSATALRQQGCSLAALKAAGFSAAALRAAGFSAAELKDAGFSAAELKDAGFSAAQLRAAGYSAKELKDAGFSAAALKAAGFSAGQLLSAGFSPKELHDAGFSAAELHKAGVTAAELRAAGYGLNALKAAGFTKGDLLRAGFSPTDAGYEKTVVAQTAAPVSEQEAAPAGTQLPSITGQTPEGRLAAFEKQEQEDMNTQQRANQIQRMQGLMTQQAQNFMSGWSNVNNQQYIKAPPPPAVTGSGAGAGGGAGGKSTTAEANEGGPTLKAGTVLFAVIDTSINSDEKTPIMARIVSGEMEGSRLMGTFTREHKSLLIQFTLLNDPHYPKSIPINAVAIDPGTARTAISGRVNSHYLLRYGTLFASSFLQGISEGIINQGVTSDCLFGNFGCSVQQTPLSTNQQIAVGLGKVGQQYAQHMGQNFNRPPTIRISSGTGLGILLMADLSLPANPMPIEKHRNGFIGLSASPSYGTEDNY